MTAIQTHQEVFKLPGSDSPLKSKDEVIKKVHQ